MESLENMKTFEDAKHAVLAVQIGHIAEGMTRIEKSIYDMKRDVHKEMDELKADVHKQISELKREIQLVDEKHSIAIEKMKNEKISSDKENLVTKVKQGFIVAGLVSFAGIVIQIAYIYISNRI